MKKVYLNISYLRNKITQGYALDISRSGIGIACLKRIRSNSLLKFSIEKSRLLPLKGRVVSVAKRKLKPYIYRIGIKFVVSGQEQKRLLARFIRRIEKRKRARLFLI